VRVSRVYTTQLLVQGESLEFAESQHHYLSRVLRLKINDSIELFNGDGLAFRGRIENISSRSLIVLVGERSDTGQLVTKSPLSVHLGACFSRGDRMDWLVQKSTEMGVARITPLISDYSGARPREEQATKKIAHWQKIAIHACEQSGRNDLPEIMPLLSLHEWIEQRTEELLLVLQPTGEKSLAQNKKPSSIALLSGAEGGFSEAELNSASSKGFEIVRFGPRVLRAETAPLAVLSVLQFLWGDLS